VDGEVGASCQVAGLAGKPGLADARLADQQKEPAPARGGVVQRDAQLSQLAFAPEKDGPTHPLGAR
jgi:hypothetical protein